MARKIVISYHYCGKDAKQEFTADSKAKQFLEDLKKQYLQHPSFYRLMEVQKLEMKLHGLLWSQTKERKRIEKQLEELAKDRAAYWNKIGFDANQHKPCLKVDIN